MNNSCAVVVLISGNGTNLQALIDASGAGGYRIAGVISNNPQAYGLTRARNSRIPTAVVNHRDFAERSSFDRSLMQQIDAFAPDLLVLAGFMRILGSDFVKHYAGRILNIHPSLLPKYPGTHTHERVLEAGDKEHGVSIHFVTEDLDGGPLVAQARVTVEPGDDAESLAGKVHAQEYQLYPQVVSLFAGQRLQLRQGQVWLDNASLPPTGMMIS